MPHIVSLPVGYMDILEKNFQVSFSVCNGKDDGYFSCRRW